MSDAPYGHVCGTCRWFLADLGKCVRFPKVEDTTKDDWCGEWTETVEAENERHAAQLAALAASMRPFKPSGRLL